MTESLPSCDSFPGTNPSVLNSTDWISFPGFCSFCLGFWPANRILPGRLPNTGPPVALGLVEKRTWQKHKSYEWLYNKRLEVYCGCDMVLTLPPSLYKQMYRICSTVLKVSAVEVAKAVLRVGHAKLVGTSNSPQRYGLLVGALGL